MKNLIVNKHFKSLVSLIPFVTLGISCLIINLYYFEVLVSPMFLDFISYFFGVSISSVIPMFYMVYRYDFCIYSKVSVYGLVSFICVNLIDSLGELMGMTFQYALTFQCISSTLIFILSLYFFISMERLLHYGDVIFDMVTKFYHFFATLIYGLFVWLGIDVDMVLYLTLMMAIDTVLGAIKAVRLGARFSFKKFMWGFIVKWIWIMIPMAVALLGKTLKIGDFTIAVQLVIRVLAANEFLSLITNAYCIKNKVDVKNIDYISKLLKALRLATQTFLQKTISKIESLGDCKMEDDNENE